MTEKTPSKQDWERAERRARRKPPCCSYCGQPDHKADHCPELLRRDDKL